MENKDFIEQLKMLTSSEDILAVSKSINDLRSQLMTFVSSKKEFLKLPF